MLHHATPATRLLKKLPAISALGLGLYAAPATAQKVLNFPQVEGMPSTKAIMDNGIVVAWTSLKSVNKFSIVKSGSPERCDWAVSSVGYSYSNIEYGNVVMIRGIKNQQFDQVSNEFSYILDRLNGTGGGPSDSTSARMEAHEYMSMAFDILRYCAKPKPVEQSSDLDTAVATGSSMNATAQPIGTGAEAKPPYGGSAANYPIYGRTVELTSGVYGTPVRYNEPELPRQLIIQSRDMQVLFSDNAIAAPATIQIYKPATEESCQYENGQPAAWRGSAPNTARTTDVVEAAAFKVLLNVVKALPEKPDQAIRLPGLMARVSYNCSRRQP